jgi:hypothetical protein
MRTVIIVVGIIAAAFLFWGWRVGKSAAQADFAFIVPTGLGTLFALADGVLIIGYALWRLFT